MPTLTKTQCHRLAPLWWETGAFTIDLLDCLGMLGMLGFLLHTTFYCLGLLELVEARHTVKYCHFSWWGHGASAIDLLGFLGFWGCLGFCFTLPSSSWDSWYLWNYWYYKHAGKVLGNQSSTIALLYLYVLWWSKLLTFPMGAWSCCLCCPLSK